MEKTMALITEDSPTIDTLSLRYKGLNAEQVQQILKALVKNTSVTSLHLSGNELSVNNVDLLVEYALLSNFDSF
jgi:hypothetical protein